MNENKLNQYLYIWLLIGSILLSYNTLVKYPVFGEYTIYVLGFTPMVFDISVIFAIIFFVCNYKKFSHKIRLVIGLILISIMCILSTWAGIGFFKDAISKPQVISSEYYIFNRNLVIYAEDSGEEIILRMSDEQYHLLKENEASVDRSKCLEISDNISIYAHDKAIIVEYYSNSEIIKKIQFAKS